MWSAEQLVSLLVHDCVLTITQNLKDLLLFVRLILQDCLILVFALRAEASGKGSDRPKTHWRLMNSDSVQVQLDFIRSKKARQLPGFLIAGLGRTA